MSLSKNKTYYMHACISIVFMFGFGFLPTFGEITELGMRVLGVFIGVLWGWIFIEMIWPSILALIALGMTGYTTVSGAFSSGFGNVTLLTVFLSFLFTALLDSCKVTDYLASKFLSAKIIIGKPWAMITMFFVADFILSVFISPVATMFMLWATFIKIAELVGYEKGDKLVGFMIAGIVFVGNCSSMVLPFKPTPVIFTGFLFSTTGLTPEYLPYALFVAIMTVVHIALLILVGKFILKLDVSKLGGEEDRFGYLRGAKAGMEQKIGIAFVAVLITALFLPSFLPKNWAITGLLSNWGLIGTIGLILVVSTILRKPDGESFCSLKNLCVGVGWDLLWLLIATFPIAGALNAPECGIMATILAFVTPIMSAIPPMLLVLICMLILGLAAQVISGVVLAAMFIPLLSPLYGTMGGNPMVMFFAVYFVLQLALATPGASMYGAMIHGHEWVAKKDAYSMGILFFIITFLAMSIIGIPLVELMFPM